MLKTVFVPINKAGWPFIFLFTATTVALAFLWKPLGWVGLILTLWCIYFFRDPPRVTPTKDHLVVSPADGSVLKIVKVIPPKEIELGNNPLNCISIFMNVFDVHVNRIPVSGKITRVAYNPGKFVNASLDKASEYNERQCIRITTNEGLEIGVIQIAGLIARRISCDVSINEMVNTGERYGLIRFGSRVDVYLPSETNVLVAVGQIMVAGETVIADLGSQEEQRFGVVI
jgi:phosphatidylserine decarboxylase